eukprot:UN14746
MLNDKTHHPLVMQMSLLIFVQNCPFPKIGDLPSSKVWRAHPARAARTFFKIKVLLKYFVSQIFLVKIIST